MSHSPPRGHGAGTCPGIAVQITQRGRPLLARHYGLANLETGTPVTGGSVFRVGSLTKQFTAALVVKLLADGRLALDDAASTHLPFFVGQPRFTLRELLHHTAGLRSDEQDTACPAGPAGPKSQVDLAREIAAQTPPFDFPPGTAWHYGNANHIVLGAIVVTTPGRQRPSTQRRPEGRRANRRQAAVMPGFSGGSTGSMTPRR